MLYAQASIVYAFSGTLSAIEADCVKQAFKAEIVTHPKLNLINAFPNVLLKHSELAVRDDWLTDLCLQISKYHMKVPIIVLGCAQYAKDITKQLKESQAAAVKVQSLIE